MKKFFDIIFFCCIICSIADAQTKTVVYTDYNQFKKAYNNYLDSIKTYNAFQDYANAVRNIEKGLTSQEYNKLDEAIKKKILTNFYSYYTKEPFNFKKPEDKKNLETGLIVFVNYTIDENTITNRYISISPYPVLKPIYKKPKPPTPTKILLAKPLTITQVENPSKNTINFIMLMDGSIYTFSEFEKRYGRQPVKFILKNKPN